VLIDEGGLSAAETRTIEAMIAQLQRDREILEMVLAAAGLLTSLGISGTTIAGRAAEELTSTVVGEVCGALVRGGSQTRQESGQRVVEHDPRLPGQ
jgi:hypothetical protein